MTHAMHNAASGFAFLIAVAAAAPASAAAIDAPVPTNAYISFGGSDWAWASPCGLSGCRQSNDDMPIDLSYQATHGWRVAEEADLLRRPAAADFVFPGANVPLHGTSVEGTTEDSYIGAPGDMACATAYFTAANPYNQCNYDQGVAGDIYGDPAWQSGDLAETWVIRDHIAAVPEPATWAMLIAGFGLVGGVQRRRRKALATVPLA